MSHPFTYAQGYRSVHSPLTLRPGNKNQTFKIGKTFTYDYNIISDKKSGKILLDRSDSRKWQIGNSLNSNSFLIDKISLQVVKRGIFQRTNFWETQISYEYKTKNVSLTEETGMIESKKNIWLHPPRSHFFKILELAPFPYVKLTKNDEGLEWIDEIVIGDHWADERWAIWEGNLKLRLKYKLKKKIEMLTSFGKIDVYEVHSISESKVGISTLDILFNESFGIIQMTYNILGKYKITFNLIDTTEFL